MIKSPIVQGLTALAMITLALAALASASRVQAAVVKVTALKDSGPGSLRQAIAAAIPGDTITFKVQGTITLTSGPLVINKDLDIEGPGPNKLKISAHKQSRVFVIEGGIVTIAGVTISDGLANASTVLGPGIGGGILIVGPLFGYAPASLNLINDVVCDNQALCEDSPNPSGPGIGAGGGVMNYGTLALIATSFIGNVARGGDGNNGSFAGHAAGGALANFGGLSIAGSTFSHNQAIGGHDNTGGMGAGSCVGGAIWTGYVGLGAYSVEIRSSRLDHNRAIGGDRNPAATTWGVGGAIQVFSGPADIIDCVLDHNDAIGGAGVAGAMGGWGLGGAVNVSNALGLGSGVTISDSTIDHNRALGGPGGLGGDGIGGGGGGLRVETGAKLTVIRTTVACNHAQGGQGLGGGKGGEGAGGGIAAFQGTLDLKEVTVGHNLALGGGPGGFGFGGGVANVESAFTYNPDDTFIEKNHASTSGDNVWP